MESWNKEADFFLSEVKRGENEISMKRWNELLVERIGIDNLFFFQLYGDTSP
jgi:hypothetical protein